MENITQETFILIAIASVTTLIIGIFIGRVSKSSDSEAAVSDMQKELEDYKKSVSEHFGKTADLVDNLTSSYKEVFDHLGISAKSLLTKEELNKHIASRSDKAITLTYTNETETSKAATPSTEQTTDEVKQTTNEVKQTTNEVKQTTDEAKQTTDEVKQTTDEVKQTTDEVKQTTDEVKQTTDEVKQTTDEVKQTTDEVKQTGEKESAQLLDSIANKTSKS